MGRAGERGAARSRRLRIRLGTAAIAGALLAAGTSVAVSARSSAPPPPPPAGQHDSTPAEPSGPPPGGLYEEGGGRAFGVVFTAEDLQSLPTSGAAWEALLSAAEEQSDDIDLSDEDSQHAAETLASALVYARTGDTAQRDHVLSVLRELPETSLSGARVLSVGRQLGGYAMAAGIVGYDDADFRDWIGEMRTRELGGHGRWTSITYTSEDSANNWGAWALATRIAISAYLGDRDDLGAAAAVFRGFTGDRDAYAGFNRTDDFDPEWACGGDDWVPINPSSCGARSGAIVEDVSRSSGDAPSVDDTGIMYSWEVLGGATLSARLLEGVGYTDVWGWGDRALLRAAQFLERHDGYPPEHSVNQYIPFEINAAYDVRLGPVDAAGYGRQFGFTDWLS